MVTRSLLLTRLSQHAIEESVALYKSSLFIVVHPLSLASNAEDDGVRLFTTPEEALLFTNLLVTTLEELGIPFMELKEPDRRRRVKLISEAVTEGKVPLSNFSLR